jgi:signal transduction histidine kinase
MPHDSLINLLEQYRGIVMSNGEKYTSQKSDYYYFLANNADTAGKGGQAIYYADKMIQEKGKMGEKSILKILFAVNYYSRNRNYKKVIEVYEKEKPFFLEYEKLLFSRKLSIAESANLIVLQTAFFVAYLQVKDYTNAEKVKSFAEKMANSLNERKDVSLKIELYIFLYLNLMEIKFLSDQGKATEAYQILQTTEKRITENKANLKSEYTPLEDILKDVKLEYLILFSSPDKALKLLDSTTSKGVISHWNELNTETQRADLLFKKGDYKSAYNTLNKSITFYKEEYVNITNEMDELLYAHSEAEQNRLELTEAETEKSRRNLIFGSIIALISLVTLTVILYYYREKKQFKKTIAELNKITELQIEEATSRATKEEKVKLGQNLHDDISGTLAGMLRLIESTEDKTHEKIVADNLGLLYIQTKAVHDSVRNKSHQMFNESDHFEESVKKIVNAALLNYDFKTDIEIDQSLSAQLNTPLKIELLRIIQESVTNILKHAKKATEAYVFMFRQGDSIFLQIGDNGLSQKSSPQSHGIGLKSINERVKTLRGKLTIDNTHGMTLNILFPAPH